MLRYANAGAELAQARMDSKLFQDDFDATPEGTALIAVLKAATDASYEAALVAAGSDLVEIHCANRRFSQPCGCGCENW